MKYVESEDLLTHSVQYHYDADNLLTSTVEYIEYMYVPMEYTTAYTYDDLDRIKTVTANGITRTYTYDSYGRITRMEDTQGETSLQTIVYTYHDTAQRISAQIATMRTTRGTAVDITYSYTYDNNGNILTVSDGTNTTSYVYDSANQLIRENNQAAGKTWTWTYDSAGNILTKNEYAYTTGDLGTLVDTIPYTYNDTDWGDLLTAYDGTAITYDTIGNPLNDGTWTYTWQNGRELATMSDGTVTWRYTYDANGMRTRRSGNNVPHGYEYIYTGGSLSQVIVDQWQTLKFTYDANGIPMMVNYENEDYYYITNLQGDVVGIADSTGTLVVSYTYDAWGKPLSITGSMADTLGVQNPLRYRGYVYDTETGYYYLQSRYYDPEIGRFINADSFVTTGGLLGNNMFAYCMNSPICYTDPDGRDPYFELTQRNLSTMMLLGMAATVIITNPEITTRISDEISQALTYAKQEVYEYAQIVKQEAINISKEPPHVHHIVPVGKFSTRSEATQQKILEMHELLSDAGINRYFNPMNLMLVSRKTHAGLHTDMYISHVHSYLMSTDGSKEQIFLALYALRLEIAAIDAFAFGY